jgi:hypothetical protein
MESFELARLKFEREQARLHLDKAIDQLDLRRVKEYLIQLSLDPLELKELQSRTSQLPNLYKKDPVQYAKAKKIADEINLQVGGTRQDKSNEQQDFLSTTLLHTLSSKELDSGIDEIR